MFSYDQLGLLLFLEGAAEIVRVNTIGTHPFYPLLIVIPFTLWAMSIRWRDWCRRSLEKRLALLNEFGVQEVPDAPRKTIVGFFHPYCNAGGGGEAVLWTIVAYIQRTEPDTICAIYSGDIDANKESIIAKVESRFDIDLSPHNLTFVWLKNRALVDATRWPKFTLLGQSFGSMLLCVEALNSLIPDIFIDSMGYAFTFPIIAYLSLLPGLDIRRIPVGAYVHYPTISTDMLERVKLRQSSFNNESDVASSSWKTKAKLIYYRVFAGLYSFSLLQADEILVNSSWTKNHIDYLLATARHWTPEALSRTIATTDGVTILYPPCNMDKLAKMPPEGRERVILSVAQFRPEKDHLTQIQAVHELLIAHPELQTATDPAQKLQLVLLGGCRTEKDEQRVEELRKLVRSLDMEDTVHFAINAPFVELLSWLARSSVGISTMVDEHFGINVVEYMASGLIPLVHASGGPLQDIVVPFGDPDPRPTGFHGTSVSSYADLLAKIFVDLSEADRLSLRHRARAAARRFGRDDFERGWATFWESLKGGLELKKER